MQSPLAEPVGLTYDSADRQHLGWREIREVYRFRRLLWLMVIHDLKQRYRRSVLGILWLLIQPLVRTILLTLVFSTAFRSQVANYPLFVLVGLLVWDYFTRVTIQGASTVTSGRDLSLRAYFPRSLHILSATGQHMITFLVGLVILAGVMVVTHVGWSPTYLLIPVAVLLLVMLTSGIASLLAVAGVYAGDVPEIYGTVTNLLFFLTPIVFARQVISDEYAWLFWLNPIMPIVTFFRSILYERSWPDPWLSLATVAVSSVFFVAGWWLFIRKSSEFPYFV